MNMHFPFSHLHNPGSRLAILVLTLILAVSGCGGRDSEGPRLVLLFLVDTLRSDRLQTYGYEHPTSPELLEFARDAVLFEHSYSTAPWTKPSVASLFTSYYPLEHRALERGDRLTSVIPTVSEHFSARGYETVAFSANPFITSEFGFNRGFDVFRAMKGSDDIKDACVEDLYEAFKSVILGRVSQRPLFVYVHAMEPHAPYEPLVEDIKTIYPDYTGATSGDINRKKWSQVSIDELNVLYDSEIRHSDRGFGKFLSLLKEEGVYDDALIVFTSDHGEEFMEHDGLGHGNRLWEELVKIPLLIKMPGNSNGGRRIARTVSLIDLVPTLLAAIGNPLEGSVVSGRSFLPLLTDEEEKEGKTPDIFIDESRVRVEMSSLRRGPWKMIYQTRPEQRLQLYDINRDPGETEDVASTNPLILEQMEEILVERMNQRTSGFWIVALAGTKTGYLSGSVRLSGRIEDLDPYGLEEGDSVERTEDGFYFRIRVSPPNVESGHLFLKLDPRKAFRFTTDPVGTEIEFEVLLDDEDLSVRNIRLGAERVYAHTNPFVTDAGDPNLFLSAHNIPMTKKKAGSPIEVMVGHIPFSENVTIDEETEERLRALGYVD